MRFKIEQIKTTLIADKTYETTLFLDSEGFFFNSGQYVWIENPFGKMAFSIASSSNNQNEIKIIYRQGKSNFKDYLIKENAKYLYISGGRGFMRFPETNKKITYIVGGVGIAPVISFIETAKDKKLETNFDLININTSKEKQFYLDKVKNYNNLVINYINDMSISFDIQNHEADFVVLGNQIFVNLVYEFLNKSGINSNQIFFEENYPTGRKVDLLLQNESIFKLAVEQSITHTIITDTNGIILYANKAAEEMTGYIFDEMRGQTPRLWGGLMEKETYLDMWRTIKYDKKPFVGELLNVKKDGTKYQVKASISPIIKDDGELIGYVASEDDITKEKEIENEAKKINELTIGRELKMIELKEKLKNYEQ